MTAPAGAATVGTVAALRRYPVKSMLGEELARLDVTAGGVEGDRALALLDVDTGRVASAKNPRLWRSLLTFSAVRDGDTVWITLPDGRSVEAGDDDIDAVLSDTVGRPVSLSRVRAAGATVERPAPEDVLDHGVEAVVPFETVEIARATPGESFVDHSPVHLITSATLAGIGVEALRYRPNIVVATSGVPFAENGWPGRDIEIGDVRLRATSPTPRCAVPTLEHGGLPRSPRAVRVPLAENRVEVAGFGVLPCAGVYAEVVRGGTIDEGAEVTLR